MLTLIRVGNVVMYANDSDLTVTDINTIVTKKTKSQLQASNDVVCRETAEESKVTSIFRCSYQASLRDKY